MRLLCFLSTLFLTFHASQASARPQPPTPLPLLPPKDLRDPSDLSPRSTCANALLNPSFDSASLSPWTIYATGSWATRSVVSSSTAHSGAHVYQARSNSSSASSITISQSFTIHKNGAGNVGCGAWVRASNTAQIDLFLDGVQCGGTGRAGKGWRKVGGVVSVQEGTHMVVLVGVVEGVGAEVSIDGFGVGKGC